MSRFLPKLFLRSSAETDISTIASLQAGKFLPSGIQQDSPTPGWLQLCPPVLSNCSKGGGETQSLYFAFKRWEGIHNQGLCIVDLQAPEWSLCVWKVNIVRERGWQCPIYHTSTIWPHCPPTNKGVADVWGLVCSPATTQQFAL